MTKKAQRLTMSVSGPGGVGKSYFASTLAQAISGRICYFDLEGRAHYLPGAGETFDVKEVEDLAQLPELVERFVKGPEGEAYGGYVLDSFSIFFSYVFGQVLREKRKPGELLALLEPGDYRAVNVICQEVLRTLCMDSRKDVVVVEQSAPKEVEEDAVGSVSLASASGLEFFVDCAAELRLEVEDFKHQVIAEVRKTNVPSIPLGMSVTSANFGTFRKMVESYETESEQLRLEPEVAGTDLTLGDLLNLAQRKGVKKEEVVLVVRRDYPDLNGDLQRLSQERLRALTARLEERPDVRGEKSPKAKTQKEVANT